MTYAGSEHHLRILKESLRRNSPRFWNRWRQNHPSVRPDLRGVVLAGKWLRGFDFARTKFDAAILERTDLGGVHLEYASLREATLRYANLSGVHAFRANLNGANFYGATLAQGDFRIASCLETTRLVHANLTGANFSHAKLVGAFLTEADLTATRFDGADLSDVDLERAILDGTSLLGTTLRRAIVSGAFIRRVQTDKNTDQRSLGLDVYVLWERRMGNAIEFTDTDDIRLAQFHDVVEEHGSIASLITACSERVVLILGRFTPQRKRVLDKLAEALTKRGKVPVIYDFPSPKDREISDTVRFIAGMSQFIVVDLTDALSVPLELQATIPDLMIPVLPIIQSGEPAFSMFADLQRRYSWIQPTVSYKNAEQLVRRVDEAIIARAKDAADQLRKQRAAAARPPVSVMRARPSRRS